MKKSLLAMTALAAMLFAGCTSSDEITTLETIKQAENAATPVSFGTYMGRTGTRSGATGDIAATADPYSATQVLAQKQGFGVFAYNTGSSTWTVAGSSTPPNFMYNQQVTGTNAATPEWSYTPIKYWPNGKDTGNATDNPSSTATEAGTQYLSFFAYGPYAQLSASALTLTGITAINGRNTSGGTTGVGNEKTGAPTISYTFDNNTANTIVDQVDLLWGTRLSTADYNQADGTTNDADAGGAYKDAANNYYNTDLTKQKTNEKIAFNFKHALTKLGGKGCLKVVLDLDGNGDGETGATITSKQANTLVTIQSIRIQNVENKFVQSGVFNLATGTWDAGLATVGEGAAIDLTYSRTGNINMSSAIVEPGSAPTWNGSTWSMTGVTTSVTDVYEDATGAPIFLIPSSANAQELKVTISYIVRTQDDNLAVPSGESANCSKVTQTITNTVTLPTTLLQPNKKITLVLHLGLTSVKFAAAVANWEDVNVGNAKEVWLPSNVIGS